MDEHDIIFLQELLHLETIIFTNKCIILYPKKISDTMKKTPSLEKIWLQEDNEEDWMVFKSKYNA